jgi:hypothetical protein
MEWLLGLMGRPDLSAAGAALIWRNEETKVEVFFFEKRTKKLLICWGYPTWRARQVAKVFATFFKKKRFLNPTPPPD